MNLSKITAFTLITFLSITVYVSATVWFQPLQPNIVMAHSQPRLTLETSTSQHKYVQFEPILIDFKLSNQTSVPITWNGIPMFGSEDIDILARTANGNDIRWSGKRSIVDGVVETEIMQPDKNKEVKNLIDEGAAEQLFPQPGRYQIRVEFSYLDLSNEQKENITIVSNPILIDIDEPKGKDRKAFDYLKNDYASAEKSNDIKEKMRVWQYFVNNFPDSVYWKYKTYKLGVIYLITGENEKAEREFLKISEIDFYHSKNVDKHFDKLISKLGRDKRNPERWHGRVVTNAPGAPVLRAIPVPSISPIPLPNNPPVLIRIPNPTPFPTPNLTP